MRKANLLWLGMLLLTSAGCRSVQEKRYAIRAEVISVDQPKGLVTLKHGEIPGLMPAMTMSYYSEH